MLVGALHVEQREVAHRAEAVLARRQVERLARQRVGLGQALQRVGIEFDRAQGVGDVLEGDEDGLFVLRPRLVVGGFGAALLGAQRTAVEDRLGHAGDDVPEQAARPEQPARLECLRADVRAQVDLRIERRRGDADLRAGVVQQGLAGPDVGALARQLGGQGRRQVRRQLQRVEADLGQAAVAGGLANVDRELAARERQRLLERRNRRLGLGDLGALLQHGCERNRAGAELGLDHRELLLLQRQHLLGRLQLGAQRGLEMAVVTMLATSVWQVASTSKRW